ncbi:SLC13 family permease [Yeosuana sp. MJ-SS3]|uniref:SLC13 family permease n=1 Tax=Gilvirhabdus luticola TaxID=3079858 RepID=A0ABU3U757_9FLAO|nr:SLC13 family permease [Yeosuana sp. MJ-SS3]MDU8885975.1 SLC13 family permease [Yeosuana sp. MJ-SS3]
MSDSRGVSLKLMSHIQRIVDIQSKIIYFLLSIIAAFVLSYLLYDSELNQAQIYVLFLLFLAIGLWVTEAIPPFAVGLLVFGFLVFSMSNYYSHIDPENVSQYYQKYVNSWSNSVIWLMLGGFFMAESMKKTELDRVVFKISISKFGTTPKFILLGLMLTTAIFSMLMSNTATTAMMIASVLPFLIQLGDDSPFTKAILLGIPGAASIGGMGTLIGSPPNAIAVEALINQGHDIGFLEWMVVGFPVSIILTLLLWFFLIKKFVPKIKSFEVDFSKITSENINDEDLKLYKIKKNVVLFVLILTLLLWLTEKLHGIPASVVSLLPIILLTMSGIIKAEDVRSLPWDTLMLVAGGLALGMAIKETGLAQHYIEKLSGYELNFYLIVLFFAFLTVILSNVMSNTATATILIPIGIILTYDNPIILPLVIGLCASTALFLPISTPPNAIAYSTGKLEQKDFRYGGFLMGIIGPVVIIATVLIILKYINPI